MKIDDYLFFFLVGFVGGGGGVFIGFGGLIEVVVGLGLGSGGVEEVCLGFEEFMNFIKVVGVFFFFVGGMLVGNVGVCDFILIIVGLVEFDFLELKF